MIPVMGTMTMRHIRSCHHATRNLTQCCIDLWFHFLICGLIVWRLGAGAGVFTLNELEHRSTRGGASFVCTGGAGGDKFEGSILLGKTLLVVKSKFQHFWRIQAGSEPSYIPAMNKGCNNGSPPVLVLG